MRDLYIRNVRLKELEPETAWGENGGDGQVELTVRETVVETLGQWPKFHRRQTVGFRRRGTYFRPRHDLEPLLNGTRYLRS